MPPRQIDRMAARRCSGGFVIGSERRGGGVVGDDFVSGSAAIDIVAQTVGGAHRARIPRNEKRPGPCGQGLLIKNAEPQRVRAGVVVVGPGAGAPGAVGPELVVVAVFGVLLLAVDVPEPFEFM